MSESIVVCMIEYTVAAEKYFQHASFGLSWNAAAVLPWLLVPCRVMCVNLQIILLVMFVMVLASHEHLSFNA